MSERPTVHAADWTPERVQSFWDNYASTKALRRNYFSASHGEGILEALERVGPLRGPVLDYACGRGDFLDVLLSRGHAAMGCDSSGESVAATSSRHVTRPGFLGAFSSDATPPQPPSTITLIEIVEHVPPPLLPGLLRRAADFLQPGGCLFTTSPHKEELEAALALCPECACLFHVSQHVASIDADSMRRAADEAGLQLVLARPTLLRRNRDRSLRTRLRRGAVESFFPDRAPHLLCQLRKR